jgi:hypothetical protein
MATRRREITADDIEGWSSLDAVVEAFEHRGLNELDGIDEIDALSNDRFSGIDSSRVRVLKLADNYFIGVIEADPEEDPAEYKRLADRPLRTVLVIDDYETFTFYTKKRSFESETARTIYQQFSFERSEFTDGGSKYSVLDKLNDLEAGDPTSPQNLYDTRAVVKKFYEQFEEIRGELIEDVSGLDDPEKPGQVKARYVQVIFNRLIFLHFIQEKGLLNHQEDYLLSRHADAQKTGSGAYETFWGPLFFRVLAEESSGEDETESNDVEDEYDISFIDDDHLPYLNGGLFTKDEVEREHSEIQLGKTQAQQDKNYERILEFLGQWNWNVDERLDIIDPKNLSPEILGHIFEQTVNQKEMGAYYTPEEITDYMADNAIRPRLLEQLNTEVGENYQSLQRALDDGGHIEELYRDVLLETRVLDPAVGSGAFLLAAQRTLIEIYLDCLYSLREKENRDALETNGEEDPVNDALSWAPRQEELKIKRAIIEHNLYGVDLDEGAVEICKLRLWLSMVANIENDPDEVEPLPNIDFNIRSGNALIGAIDDTETEDRINESLSQYDEGQESIDEMVDTIATRIQEHKPLEGDEAAAHREETESLMAEYREILNEDTFEKFPGGGEDLSPDGADIEPFHWVIEFARVYKEGWFDVIIGNPPWDRLRPTRDKFYADYIEGFRTMLPSEQEAAIEALQEKDDSIEADFKRFEEDIKQLAEYYHDEFELQDPEVAGRKRSTEKDLSALFLERVYELGQEKTYIAQLLPGNIFTGLATKALRDELLNEKEIKSIVGFENKGIFDALHNQYKFGAVVFKNSGHTEELQGTFGQTSLKVLRELREGDERGLLSIPRKVLADYSPIAGTFPIVDQQEQVDALQKIVDHPPISDREGSPWYANPYDELHRTQDKGYFLESEPEDGYPVLGGSNIYLFAHDSQPFSTIEDPKFWGVNDDPEHDAKQRIREKNLRKLKGEIYDYLKQSEAARNQLGVSVQSSKKATVNELMQKTRDRDLQTKDVKLDASEYRIVFRDVAQPTDERTMVASLIPPGRVCHNKLHTVRPLEINPDISDFELDGGDPDEGIHGVYDRIFENEELLATVGLLNSIPFDYLMRTKVDKSVVMYKFRESQVPHLTEGDEYFEEIWKQAAKLNCYGEAFEPLLEDLDGIDEPVEPDGDSDVRRQTQAKLDAAAFHAYGFDEDEVEFILNDFSRVGNPRIMDEAYFDCVREQFGELS